MEEIRLDRVQSASIVVSNYGDENKVFNISSAVSVDGQGNVTSLGGGSVKKEDGTEIASFTSYANTNINMQFNTLDESEQLAILSAVNQFTASARAVVKNISVTI